MDTWIRKDLKYVWHPYTQMKDCETLPPILIERAKGIKLYDNRGNIYYDTISSWWCNVHGHNHPKINAAISEQLNNFEHVLFAGFTHKPAISLAEKLVSMAPAGYTRVMLLSGGSEAIENAFKIARQYQVLTGREQKYRIVSRWQGFHGNTLSADAAGGHSGRRSRVERQSQAV